MHNIVSLIVGILKISFIEEFFFLLFFIVLVYKPQPAEPVIHIITNQENVTVESCKHTNRISLGTDGDSINDSEQRQNVLSPAPSGIHT